MRKRGEEEMDVIPLDDRERSCDGIASPPVVDSSSSRIIETMIMRSHESR